MKKKLLYLILTISVLSLATGCGKKEAESKEDKKETVEETKDTDDIEEIEVEEVVVEEAESEPELTADELIEQAYNMENQEEYDVNEVIALYEKAVEQGSAEAKWRLAGSYADKQSEDYDKAMQLAKEAIDEGCPEGYNILAYCYYNGMGVEEDIAKAEELCNQGIEAGSYSCYATLGNIYSKSEDTYGQMFECFIKYVEECPEKYRNSSYSTYWGGLAGAYMDGQGVEVDLDEAFNCIKKMIEYSGDKYIPSIPLLLGNVEYYERCNGNTDKAKMIVDYSIDANYPLGAYNYGAELMNQGDFEAAKEYMTAIAADERIYADVEMVKSRKINLLAGQCCFRTQDYSECLKYWQKAQQIGEDGAEEVSDLIDQLIEKGF